MSSDPTYSPAPRGSSPPPRSATAPPAPAAGHLPSPHRPPPEPPPSAPAPETGAAGPSVPRQGRPRSRRLAKEPEAPRPPLTGAQRLLILDAWRRSGLPAGD